MNILFRYRKLFIVLVFLLLPAKILYSQSFHTVKGAVLDKETNEPIPAVHVYISQTTIGTTSKSDGTFEFTTRLSGVHTVVFSYVGYKTEVQEINFYSDSRPYFEIKLTPSPVELNAIEVTGSNKEWLENFKIFRENFIGLTTAAQDTKIENPWVIDFEWDENENLIASSGSPLTIYNYALGYKLHVDLMDFKWPKNGEIGYYIFHASYSEIEPRNKRENRQWAKNRRDVYQGSFEHFLQSLYDDNLKNNGFEVVIPGTYNIIKLDPLDNVNMAGLRSIVNIPGVTLEDVKIYQLKSPVDVLYGSKWFDMTERERSRIVPMAGNGVFMITNQARLLNPISLRLDGVWAAHRLANLLPENYALEE